MTTLGVYSPNIAYRCLRPKSTTQSQFYNDFHKKNFLLLANIAHCLLCGVLVTSMQGQPTSDVIY